MPSPRIERVPGTWAVARLAADAEIPAWVTPASFTSITRSDAELSIVAPESCVPAGVRAERGFAVWRVAGAIPFDAVGVLRSLLSPLESSGIPVLAISTFDTDYLLIREVDAGRAIPALRAAGIPIA